MIITNMADGVTKTKQFYKVVQVSIRLGPITITELLDSQKLG